MASEFLARSEEMVDGTYRLGALIRRSVRSVVYETEFGDSALPAVIKVREMEGADAENLIAQLRKAGELAHPNFLKIYAAGSSVLNDVPIVYVVMERADLSLQEVVAERALANSEALEMLVPALKVLQYLHKEGYAHSRLSASNVLAVKDQLKLSSDSVIRAGEDVRAEDVRALGVLIVQALTQQNPDEELPEPFADIVRHCLDPDPGRRWTVEQVQARLETPALAAVPPRRSLPVESAPRPEETEPKAYPLKTGVPKWIYAGLAAIVLVVLLAAVMRKKDAAPVATAAVETVPPTPIQQHPPAEAPAPRAEVKPPVSGPVSRPVSRPRGRKADGWSVIVGAYGAREPAEKRMRAMMSRWPNFKISVSERHAEKTHYLVVLGENLSEDQAEALRKRAVESGLPRDTYIKRVM
jgi:tRNA A-37 threonylcarbamoyl transferase component Bud32/cell division protein FtsN